MADKPDKTPANSDAEGAGTSPAEAPASQDTKDAQIAALQAQLAARDAQDAVAKLQAAQQPAPATFSAPSAELIGKHDSVTGLIQQLPAKLWDVLSEEDKERFSPYVADKPEALPTV